MYHFKNKENSYPTKSRKLKQQNKNMIFEKSFLSFVLFATLAAIYIKDYNEVEANSTILENLTFKRVKQDFRCALIRRRNRLTTSSQPNQITSSVLTVTQQGITSQLTNSTEISSTTGKF